MRASTSANMKSFPIREEAPLIRMVLGTNSRLTLPDLGVATDEVALFDVSLWVGTCPLWFSLLFGLPFGLDFLWFPFGKRFPGSPFLSGFSAVLVWVLRVRLVTRRQTSDAQRNASRGVFAKMWL